MTALLSSSSPSDGPNFVQDAKDTIQIKLQNIVATVNLGVQLDLVSKRIFLRSKIAGFYPMHLLLSRIELHKRHGMQNTTRSASRP